MSPLPRNNRQMLVTCKEKGRCYQLLEIREQYMLKKQTQPIIYEIEVQSLYLISGPGSTVLKATSGHRD